MSTSTVIPGVKREDWNQVTDGAKEVVGAVENMASHAVSAAGGFVSQAACDVSNKADQLVARAGTGIPEMGDCMGRNLPQNGMLGSASQSLAGGRSGRRQFRWQCV